MGSAVMPLNIVWRNPSPPAAPKKSILQLMSVDPHRARYSVTTPSFKGSFDLHPGGASAHSLLVPILKRRGNSGFVNDTCPQEAFRGQLWYWY
jgi:hypothetical protein